MTTRKRVGAVVLLMVAGLAILARIGCENEVRPAVSVPVRFEDAVTGRELNDVIVLRTYGQAPPRSWSPIGHNGGGVFAVTGAEIFRLDSGDDLSQPQVRVHVWMGLSGPMEQSRNIGYSFFHEGYITSGDSDFTVASWSSVGKTMLVKLQPETVKPAWSVGTSAKVHIDAFCDKKLPKLQGDLSLVPQLFQILEGQLQRALAADPKDADSRAALRKLRAARATAE